MIPGCGVQLGRTKTDQDGTGLSVSPNSVWLGRTTEHLPSCNLVHLGLERSAGP